MSNGIGWAIKELQDGRKVRRKVFDTKVCIGIERKTRKKIFMRLQDGRFVEWRVAQSDVLGVDWEGAE